MCPRNLNIEKKLFYVQWTLPTLIKARPHVAFCILSHTGNSMTSSNAFSSKLIDDNSPSPLNVLKLIWFDERFLTNL